jgi:hypothetical protein
MYNRFNGTMIEPLQPLNSVSFAPVIPAEVVPAHIPDNSVHMAPPPPPPIAYDLYANTVQSPLPGSMAPMQGKPIDGGPYKYLLTRYSTHEPFRGPISYVFAVREGLQFEDKELGYIYLDLPYALC